MVESLSLKHFNCLSCLVVSICLTPASRHIFRTFATMIPSSQRSIQSSIFNAAYPRWGHGCAVSSPSGIEARGGVHPGLVTSQSQCAHRQPSTLTFKPKNKKTKKILWTGSAFLLFESIPWYLPPLSFLMELHNSLRLNPISTRCSNPVKMRWHIFYVVKVNYKKINTKRLQGTPSQFHCRHDVYFYVHKSNISNGNYGGGRRYRGKLSDSLVRITSFAGIPPGVTVQLSDCCGFVLTSMQSHKFIGNISEAEFLFL